MDLVLYSGPHCELCDVALNLVYTSLPAGSYDLEKVDVTSSLELKKKYGLRIPVLKNKQTDKELGWPFDQDQLLNFYQSAL